MTRYDDNLLRSYSIEPCGQFFIPIEIDGHDIHRLRKKTDTDNTMEALERLIENNEKMWRRYTNKSFSKIIDILHTRAYDENRYDFANYLESKLAEADKKDPDQPCDIEVFRDIRVRFEKDKTHHSTTSP